MTDELMPRRCKASNAHGSPCGQKPVSDRAYCFWHDPELAQERREAVRLGGQNHRREQTLGIVFDVGEGDTPEDIKRYIDISLKGLLSLDNSVQRNRALISGAMAALDAYERLKLAKGLSEIQSILEARAEGQEGKKRHWGFGGLR